MANVISTPVKVGVATLNAGGFISHGQSLTVTVNITGAWETQVPTGVRYGSNVSLAAAVFVYPSNDGGVTYDTEPLVAYSIPTLASANKIASVRLTTGQYAVRMLASSPSCTFYVLTQEVITALLNV